MLTLPLLVSVATLSSQAIADELETILGKTLAGAEINFAEYAEKYGIETGETKEKDDDIASVFKTPATSSISEPVRIISSSVDKDNVNSALENVDAPKTSLFLRNVPQGSLIGFNDNSFMILPYETTAFFQSGKRIYEEPAIKDGAPVTFCIVTLKESGKGRRATTSSILSVTGVEEHNSLFQSSPQDGGTLVRVTKFSIDNPELKQLVCIGAGVSSPLSVRDLQNITGGLMTIKTQEYISI